MAKSDINKLASEGWTKKWDEAWNRAFGNVSEEEKIVRWKRKIGELPELSEEQFQEYINKIREAYEV